MKALRKVSNPFRAFTIIELLAVIAVIAILAGILLPALNSARRSSLKAKSLAQFSQWVIALEGFRQEYGYYPFSTANGDTQFLINEGTNRVLFEQVLDGSHLSINRRGIPFYRLTDSDLVDPNDSLSAIQDAFGNTHLVILIDSDRDGRIQAGAFDIRSSLEVVAIEDIQLGYPRITTWSEN